MNEKHLHYNDCSFVENDSEKLRDEVRLLEISEAIHDLDGKLTDLEIALNISEQSKNA